MPRRHSMRLQVVEIPKVTLGEAVDRGCLLIFDEVTDIDAFPTNLSTFKGEAGISSILVFEERVEVVR
jgi:hypothetical protein